MEEQRQNMSLQYSAMRALYSAISGNVRAQNHFRSIGGLEVLLDGIGVISNRDNPVKSASFSLEKGDENILLGVLQLHLLCLQVLREAIYGNLNNLQFLRESGRVHKLANSFCSPAFILQECKHQMQKILREDDIHISNVISENFDMEQRWNTEASNDILGDCSFAQYWKNYAVEWSRVLCSFILALDDEHANVVERAAGKSSSSASAAYIELSVKWFLRVLLVIFPCIKACSNEDELPEHMRFTPRCRFSFVSDEKTSLTQ